MIACFADTFYYLALLNENDSAHEEAERISRACRGPIVTTAWVLTEVADALATPPARDVFLSLLDLLRNDAKVIVVSATQEWFDRGVSLYRQRSDKAWSLTNCISFSIMTELRLW